MTAKSPNTAFQITTSYEFFQKLLEEYHDFNNDHLSPRFAINCAINSWHLTDWTFNEFYRKARKFKNKYEFKNGEEKKIEPINAYRNELTEKCPELELMRQIANGTKHCLRNNNYNTTESTGDYSSDYDRNSYDVSRFLIIDKQTNSEIDFEDALLATIEYWRNFFKERGITA